MSWACSVATHVQRTLPPDGVKFSQFLDVLASADKNGWSPVRVYKEVGQVLEPWPHLLMLFTELLSETDCVLAGAMVERMEVTNVREFATRLKEHFRDSPLSLTDIVEQLSALDSATLTPDKVESTLLPLVMAHEELAQSLRRFIYQFPPKQLLGGWEEVHFDTPPDEFETVSVSQLKAITTAIKANTEIPNSEAPSTQPSAQLKRQWSRQEDSMILKQYLHLRQPHVFGQVAAAISRTPQEVECRYNELLGLIHSVRNSTSDD